MAGEGTAPPPREPPPGYAGPGPGTASEISRRVGSILDAVEREAARLREEAREEAALYLDYAKRRADALVEERRRRIAQISEELVGKSEAVVARLDDAAPVQQGFENLVRALGGAAERLAREVELSGSDFRVPPFHAAIPAPPAPPAAPPAPAPPPPQPAAEPPQAAAAATPSLPPTPPRTTPPPTTPPPPAIAPPAARPPDEVRTVAIQLAAAGATRGGTREHLNRVLGAADTGEVLDEVFGGGSAEDATVPWTARRR